MSNRGNVLILSAPSGSGKTSLAHRVLPQLSNLRFSVSHTTRQRRRGEEDGKEYFFVTDAQFEEMVRRDAFLEWAKVYGYYYGTSREFVETQLETGTDVLLDIDIQGALKVKELVPDAVMIFVMPPSFGELEARLRGRGLDDEDVIERRLQVARDEIKYYREYNFVIINRDLEQSVAELKAVITSIRCRVERRKAQAEEIVETFHS